MKTSSKLKIFVYVFLLVSLILYITLKDKNYNTIPAFVSDEVVNAVIEIPAGTNKKIEYNASYNEFQMDQMDGIDRIIDFLPCPFNYGFIPSTFMDPEKGGDGDELDIIILSESLASATVLKVVPVGMLILSDSNEVDNKILAIPENDEMRILKATSLMDLQNNYPAVLLIIEHWFLNYKGDSVMQIIGWESSEKAIQEIQKWQR